MRYISTAAVVLLICSTASTAQTLAQVAEKERVRRSELEESKARLVFTEAHLRSGEEDDDVVVSRPIDGEVETREAGPPLIPENPFLSYLADDGAKSTSFDPWPDIYMQYQTAYQEATGLLKRAEAFEGYCEGGAAPSEIPVFKGWYWTADCRSAPEEVERVERAIGEIVSACFDHARRLRVPPGRARLD